MCAWWTGQPTFGSGPVSKFVRENFAYIKPLIDLLSGSAVTQADLTKLHATAPYSPAIGELSSFLDTGGSKNIVLSFEPSVVIFFCTLQAWSPIGGGMSFGFDDGTTHKCLSTSQDLTDDHSYFINDTYSILVTHDAGTPERTAYISSKGATGFTITVGGVGVQLGYKGIYLALP